MASFKELPRCPYCGAEMFLCPKWAGYLEFLCPKCKSSSPKCETVSEVWETTANRAKPASRALKPEEIEKAEVIWMEEMLDGQALPVVAMLVYGKVCDDANSYCPCIAFASRDGEITDYPLEDYRKNWRCWLSKPSEEERASRPWSNDSAEGSVAVDETR